MKKNVEEKILQLQVLEQNLQQVLIQKQNLQSQLIEIDNAVDELKKNPKKVFKIVGTVMIESQKETLEKDLNEKKEILQIKLKNFEKQDDKLRGMVQALQEEVLNEMKK